MIWKLILIGIFLQNTKGDVNKSHTKSCASLLGEYKDTMKNFLACSMQNAVPVTFCFGCSLYYTNLTIQYDKLVTSEVLENNRTVNCREKYIDNDRLNIVLNNHDYFTNLWKTAACEDCFFPNTTTNSNKTTTMFHKLDDLRQCLTQYWDNKPCENCNISYTKANTYYEDEFVKKNKDFICFDIRDSMNRTRSLWSQTLKCCKREGNFGGFAIAATIFSCFPVIFYISFFVYTRKILAFEEALRDAQNDNISQQSSTSDASNINITSNNASDVGEASGYSTREAPEVYDDIKRNKKDFNKYSESDDECVLNKSDNPDQSKQNTKIAKTSNKYVNLDNEDDDEPIAFNPKSNKELEPRKNENNERLIDI